MTEGGHLLHRGCILTGYLPYSLLGPAAGVR